MHVKPSYSSASQHQPQKMTKITSGDPERTKFLRNFQEKMVLTNLFTISIK